METSSCLLIPACGSFAAMSWNFWIAVSWIEPCPIPSSAPTSPDGERDHREPGDPGMREAGLAQTHHRFVPGGRPGRLTVSSCLRAGNSDNSSMDSDIFQIRTKAPGPVGKLPVTEDLLLNRPSGDL